MHYIRAVKTEEIDLYKGQQLLPDAVECILGYGGTSVVDKSLLRHCARWVTSGQIDRLSITSCRNTTYSAVSVTVNIKMCLHYFFYLIDPDY